MSWVSNLSHKSSFIESTMAPKKKSKTSPSRPQKLGEVQDPPPPKKPSYFLDHEWASFVISCKILGRNISDNITRFSVDSMGGTNKPLLHTLLQKLQSEAAQRQAAVKPVDATKPKTSFKPASRNLFGSSSASSSSTSSASQPGCHPATATSSSAKSTERGRAPGGGLSKSQILANLAESQSQTFDSSQSQTFDSQSLESLPLDPLFPEILADLGYVPVEITAVSLPEEKNTGFSSEEDNLVIDEQAARVDNIIR